MRFLLLFLSLFAVTAKAQNSPCYWSGQLVKCFPTTGLYLDAGRTLRLGDSTTNYVELKGAGSVTTYSLTLPPAQGGALQTFSNDGSGVLSWITPKLGTVTNVTGTLPISVATGTTTPVVSISQSATAANGYLSSTDWNTFNGKQASGSYITALTGDVSASGPGSAVATLATVTVGKGGTGLTSGTSGGVLAYTASGTLASSGALTANAVVVGGGAGVVPTVVTNNATATNKFLTQSSAGAPAWATLAIGDIPGPAATAADGYLSSTDWNTFNTKVGTARSIATTAPLTGGGNLTTDRTFAITQSATAADGYLSSTDWNTFNTKVPTTRTISTTAPITGGGDLSTNRTIAISAASSSAVGTVSYEDSGTFTETFAGPRTQAQHTWTYSRVGKQVTMYWPTDSAAACGVATIFTGGSTIPAGIIPAVTVIGPVWVEDNNAFPDAAGIISVSSAGAITVSKSNSAANFTASGSCTFFRGSFTYTVN